MGKKLIMVFSILLISMLACSIPVTISFGGGTETPATVGGSGVTPSSTDVTPEVVLPPPAVAPVLQVVYSKGGNLWKWTETSAPTQLTSSGSDSSPLISPDGQQIAFLRGGDFWAINTDGSNPRQLASSASLTSLVAPSSGTAIVQWFRWEPNNASVFFGTSTASDPYTIPNYDLLKVPADASTPPQMLKGSGLGGIGTFSPNGQWIAMAQPTKILLMNTDGSNYHEAFTFDLVQTYSEWFYVPDVVWFSDSSELRTVIPAHDSLGNPSEGTYFWSVPVAGSPVEMAGFTAAPAFQSKPVISPDGLNVAYMSPNGTDWDLHLNGFSIGDVLFSTYPANQWDIVDWAPDSNGFVYWADNTRNLWFGHIGSAAVKLTDTPQAENLLWIDISRILFINSGELRIGSPGGASTVIDTGVTDGFDYSN